jgi:hypothetical protein
MSMLTLLIVVAVLVMLGSLPRWRYSRDWGYAPSGSVGIVLLVLVVLILARGL